MEEQETEEKKKEERSKDVLERQEDQKVIPGYRRSRGK